MEMKEVLIRVWEKMNCKETLKRYSVTLNECGTELMELLYVIPCPTKDSVTQHGRISVRCYTDRQGFTGAIPYTICYDCTENEIVELRYIFHQIKNKLEEIRRDELLEILQS